MNDFKELKTNAENGGIPYDKRELLDLTKGCVSVSFRACSFQFDKPLYEHRFTLNMTELDMANRMIRFERQIGQWITNYQYTEIVIESI